MALTKIKTGGITDSAITTAKINDDAVTDAKVADAITVTGAQTGITQTGTLTSFASTGIDDNATSNRITLTDNGLTLKSTSYQILELQMDSDDSGSNDDAIIKFSTGSAGTLKAEMRYDESSDTFEINRSDNGNDFVLDSSGSVGIGIDSSILGDVHIKKDAPFLMLQATDGGAYPSDIKIQQDYRTSIFGTSAGDGQFVFKNNVAGAGEPKDSGDVLMVIQDNSKVGIGTTSPANDVSGLHIAVASSTDQLYLERTGSGTGRWWLGTASNSLYFQDDVANATRMIIDSSGNVGIGVTPKSDWNSGYKALQLGTTATLMSPASGDGNWISNNAIFSSSGSWEYIQTASASSLDMQSGTAPFRFRYATSGTAGTAISWSEAMRIDSSGNVLVGTTSNNPTSSGVNVAGQEFSTTGGVRSTVASNPAGTFNRKTDNGAVVLFRKDGSTVGSIGSEGNDSLYIQSGTTSGSGLHFHPTGALVRPAQNGATVDATIDLGSSNRRFKDFYLTGGIQFDARSNKLDDYEEGTFDVTVSDDGGGSYTVNSSYNRFTYTKIGRLVTIEGRVRFTSVTSPSGTLSINGLPFTSAGLGEDASQTAMTVYIRNAGTAVPQGVVGQMGTGTTSIEIFENATGGAGNMAGSIDAGTFIMVGGTYVAS